MSSLTLELNLARNLVDNEFDAELHNVNLAVDRSVWPIYHPFFKDDKLLIEGRKNLGAWEELTENVDYAFSPQFTDFLGPSGFEIFSYIVLLNDNFDQVRFGYNSLGKFQDEKLIAELAQKESAGDFDRTSKLDWSKLFGAYLNYHPLVQDPNVLGRSEQEVMYLQLQKIVDALSNPPSSVLPRDITALQLDLAGKTSVQDVIDIINSQGAGDPVTAAAGTNVQVARVANTVAAFFGKLFVQTDGGAFNLIDITCARPSDSEPYGVSVSETTNDAANTLPDLSVVQQGSEFVLVVKCPSDSKVVFNQLGAFTKV